MHTSRPARAQPHSRATPRARRRTPTASTTRVPSRYTPHPPHAHHHRNAPSHENTVDPTPSLQRRLEASRPHTICGRCHQRGSSLSSGSPRTDSPTLSPRSPTSVLTIARRTPYVPPAHRHRHASLATGWRERTETALAAVATRRPPSPRNYDLPPPSPRATSALASGGASRCAQGGRGSGPAAPTDLTASPRVVRCGVTACGS